MKISIFTRRIIKSSGFVAAICLLGNTPAHASGTPAEGGTGVSLSTTRVIVHEGEPETQLSVRDTDTTHTVLINARVLDSNGHKTHDFIITPPLFRMGYIEGSSPVMENTLRILTATPSSPLPLDRESQYLIAVQAIPSINPEETKGKNVLQIAVTSQIKLFYRPTGLTQAQAMKAKDMLRFVCKNNQTIVRNPSPFFVTMIHASVGRKPVANVMVSPKNQATLSTASCGTVAYQTINDYGAITPIQQSITASS